MKQRIAVTLLLSFFFNYSFSQSENQFIGALKLNDSSFISYRILFEETNGVVTGFSVTDFGGPHETKSKITGSYDKKKGVIRFKESGIVYTKSQVNRYDFCFVTFSGKLSKLKNAKSLKGQFKGVYSDGSSCIDGELAMTSYEKIKKRAVTADRMIQKTKKISKEQKARVSVQKSVDTLSMNVMRESQNMSLFTKDPFIEIEIYDAGREDGDRITIRANKKIYLDDYTVSRDHRKIQIPIKTDETEIEIIAENEGGAPPNTAFLIVRDSEKEIETVTNLKKGKRSKITILRKP
ncbi:MAG TPA: hypothetical protein VK183_03580 [Flavobacterium sp.]|nr:hypothetical protein [Flavobacterium sp.]